MTPDALAALHAAAFTQTRAWSADEFRALLATKGTFVVGNTTCFAMIRVIADEAEVLTIATIPQSRRQGLGRATLLAAERKAHSAGATAIFLEVAEDNTGARGLYQGTGYTKVGTRQNYYTPKNGAPVAAIVMRKDLTAS